MRKRRRLLVMLPLLAVAVAGCGDDEETATETVTETVTQTVPRAETTPLDESTEAEPGPSTTGPGTTPGARAGDCGQQGGYRVEIVSGQLSCDQARAAVSGFDLQGPKVQEIGGYTCEGGEADTRPVLFTCTAGDNEVVAKAAGE